MNKYRILLLLIIILSGLLRFYKLGENPPSLAWDEAALGYNAYSLGLDGKDEFGRFLPLDYIESFGDFKPPVYAYLTILPVKIFGLNEFSTRFASAFFGTLTVLITYFLVIELFMLKNFARAKKINKHKIYSWLPLISTLLLAISPWHINLSRAAFEANVAQFFIVAGVWLFLLALRRYSWVLILSAISFVFSCYTFNTARIVTPLLVLMLSIGFFRRLLKYKKWVIVAAVVGLLLSIPFTRFMLTPQAKLRFQEVNIFSDIEIIKITNREIENDNNAFWSRILHNRRLAYSVEYTRHFLDHFNPAFLFIKGDGNPKFSTQDIGQLYLWDLPFLIIGVLMVLRKKEGYWWVIPAWLLLAIVPAATARETPHALRIETTLPMWQILTAYGVMSLNVMLKARSEKQQLKTKKFLLILILPVLLFVNLVYYLHGYYVHYPIEYSGEWQYGYKQAIDFVESVKKDYDKIIFTTELGRPYIYILFYSKAVPNFFRTTAQIEKEAFGFVHVNSYGKYIFTKNVISVKPRGDRVLYVDVYHKLPSNSKLRKSFNLLNGQPILAAFEI